MAPMIAPPAIGFPQRWKAVPPKKEPIPTGMDTIQAEMIIKGPKYRPEVFPAPIIISAPYVEVLPSLLMVILRIPMMSTPMAVPIAAPVMTARGKEEIGETSPEPHSMAGIPTPTPVRIDPPKSRIPTNGPSSTRAKRKLKPKAAAAL